MKRPSPGLLTTSLVLAALAGFGVYWFAFARTPVLAHTVARGEVVTEVMGTGTLEARTKTTVSARISERLAAVLVDQGDSVQAGQLLARLEDAESRLQAAIAGATLAAAKQSAERVRADLARAEAVLALAQLDYTRQAGLLASRSVAQSGVDKSAETLRIAQADLNRSRAAIAEAEGQITVAEKNLLYRQEQLGFTEIHSPYAGLVIRRDREVGDMLVPGASLLQLISLDELWVSAWVDETALPALAPAQPARIVFRSEPGRSFPGQVARLGREMDRETREFLVDVRAAELPRNWTIGQRAEVYVQTSRQADAVRIPVPFLVWSAGRPGVFVSAGGRAQWRDLTLGPRGTDMVAVTKGLSTGEQVVQPSARPAPPLRDGQRIRLP